MILLYPINAKTPLYPCCLGEQNRMCQNNFMRGSFFQSVFVTIVIAVILRLFVIQPFVVDGASMEPSFQHQEYIMIDKLSYRFRPPARGEVVVFHPPTNPTENYIKRIIGLPTETVRIHNGEGYIDGHRLTEAYLGKNQHSTLPFTKTSSITLKNDEYFV